MAQASLASFFNLGFIGAGNMAKNIARGVARSGTIRPHNIRTSHPRPERCSVFQSFGVKILQNNAQVVDESDVVVLSVKPQMVKGVLSDLKPSLKGSKLLVSLAAGIKLKDLEINNFLLPMRRFMGGRFPLASKYFNEAPMRIRRGRFPLFDEAVKEAEKDTIKDTIKDTVKGTVKVKETPPPMRRRLPADDASVAAATRDLAATTRDLAAAAREAAAAARADEAEESDASGAIIAYAIIASFAIILLANNK